jgi:hypothetical protein
MTGVAIHHMAPADLAVAVRLHTVALLVGAAAPGLAQDVAPGGGNEGVRDARSGGDPWSHGPRRISAPAARKMSRSRCSSPRQRRSAQALARWPIACSTSARSPGLQRL